MRVITVARKPLAGTVAANALKYGTGGLNVDAGRLGGGEERRIDNYPSSGQHGCISRRGEGSHAGETYESRVTTAGRWPANVILQHEPGCRLTGKRTVQGYTINRWTDGAKPFGGGAGHEYESIIPLVTEDVEIWECVAGCPVKDIDDQGGERTSGKVVTRRDTTKGHQGVVYGAESRGAEPVEWYGDSGVVSRYFKQVQADPDFFRAAGDCLCSVCNEPYRKHPYDMKTLAWHGEPWLHVLCDGRRVKL